jgi:CheY-like chemotaxis protein/nitrogen-specific signal transduction histidine kinase
MAVKSGSKKRPAKKRIPAGRARKRIKDKASRGVVEAALAVFAHEVRTPLTGILAISDLLATSDLDERERRWVDTIKAGAEHLASLATLFVDAAKDSNGTVGMREDLFDLRALARSAGDSLAGRAAAKGLQSQVEISEELPSLVVGDPVRLRAALENLIDNAVKFTGQGGVALTAMPVRGGKGQVKGGIKGNKGRVGVAFAISDSGIGLTLSEIKRLFRRFSQANVSIASRFGGAGLGLSSVKQLARTMGGDIVVTPRRGGGTTFTLTVTFVPAKGGKATGSGTGNDLSTEPAPPLRVLSVEDNPFGRVVLNTILSELGHQAEFIGRGETATERIAQGTFDAVLMDMVLPGIDGVEAIRRIRGLGPPLGRIAIIGVSGRGDDEEASRAAGADAFLLKPVSPRALATALLEATRRAAAAT